MLQFYSSCFRNQICRFGSKSHIVIKKEPPNHNIGFRTSFTYGSYYSVSIFVFEQELTLEHLLYLSKDCRVKFHNLEENSYILLLKIIVTHIEIRLDRIKDTCLIRYFIVPYLFMIQIQAHAI